MRVYLDNCCYNRPFDDQKQLRIRLEAEAKLGVQEMILERKVELAWSYIIDFENEMNPFEQRKMLVRQWRTHATVDTDETKEIIEKAEALVHMGLKSKDALHMACAISLQCDYFLTTDDHLIKKVIGIEGIKVTDPIIFIREARMITDTEIKIKGFRVLLESLGEVEAERFISLIMREPFDYTKWQRSLWIDKTVAEISSHAMRFRGEEGPSEERQ